MTKSKKRHHRSKTLQNPILAVASRTASQLTSEAMLPIIQVCVDAAMLAANKVFHMGPSRAPGFRDAFVDFFNEIWDTLFDETDDGSYAKAKTDAALKRICGPSFPSWDERHKNSRRIFIQIMLGGLLSRVHSLEGENRMLRERLVALGEEMPDEFGES